MSGSRLAKSLLAGAAVLTLGAGPVLAQQGGRAARGGQGYQPTYGQRKLPNGSYIRELPPEPLSPNSLGILEQHFIQMRNSSPRPNQFMNGRWNPRYEVVRPPIQVQPGTGGGYYVPPVVYPYPSYGYPPYGYGHNPYGYPPQGPIIQREVYVYPQGPATPPGAGYYPPGTQTAPVQPQAREVPPATGAKPSTDEFLRGAEAETLTGALDDIRKAWLNGDIDRLEARLNVSGKLKVFLKGEYKYSVDGKEFAGMIKEAMGKIDTLAFEFDRPKSEDGTRTFVSGKHTFTDAEKQKQTTYISYGLEKIGGKWKITEAGSSNTPITAHAQ